jgi:signal transduction histidine kinase
VNESKPRREQVRLIGDIDKRDQQRDVYRRVTGQERTLWSVTLLVVAMSAATLALLTLGSAMSGVFGRAAGGYLLAGSSFFLLAGFILYVFSQRRTFETERRRVFRELETRSEELARSNEALQDALKTRDVFLSTVSHELKTPLTCIMAYGEFLADQELDPEEVRTHATALTEEGRCLARLIEQMVEVTRFRSGSFRLDCERTDLNGVLDGAVERVSEAAREKGLELDLDLDPRGLPVRLDLEHVPGVLDDLLRNLCGRCEPGARILVRSRRQDEGWAELSVTATGSSAGVQGGASIFHPFSQLIEQPQGRSGDLGLTLPLLNRYVTAHGGTLRIAEGDPDMFELTANLPLATPPSLTAEAA